MQKRLLFPVLLGAIGVMILLSLSAWQFQRLVWKNGVLAQIDERIAARAISVPETPDPVADKYLPVEAVGTTGNRELLVLTSKSGQGPGFRVITSFETEGRILMLDRGFVAQKDRDTPRPPVALSVIGNLHWPDETDGFTPVPDLTAGIWFARDVAAMAAHLGTEPVLIVARSTRPSEATITPLPVTSAGISNDHLGYAMTWLMLAVAWAGMSAYLILRIRRKTL